MSLDYNWHVVLSTPNRSLADFLISGIQDGFHVGFIPYGTQIKSAKQTHEKRNNNSAF